MYPAGHESPDESNFWPNWNSHYFPVAKTRNQLHRRNIYAPPAYSASIPDGTNFPRQRRTLLDSTSPPLSNLLHTADSLMQSSFARNTLLSDFELKWYNCPLPLNVRCEVKSVETTIIWDTPTFTSRAPQYFTYVLRVEGGERPETFEMANWKTRLTVPLLPGTYYTATVEAVSPGRTIMACGRTEFKAVFNAMELYKVYNLALAHLKPLNEKCPLFGLQQFQIFYRNKPTAYFDQVRNHDRNVMIKYRKDDNGHLASPINGEIEGLFFNARQPGGQLPKSSPFGNVRISIPAQRLFTPYEHSLYFCDFYCNNSTHYVTVVCCHRGSPTDQFCKRYLMKLDPTNNVFLFARVNPYSGEMEHYVNGSIWVEFYYTENVPISWGFFDTVFSTGQSKPNGVPNNKWCTICNLYPIPADSSSPLLDSNSSQSEPSTSKRRAGSTSIDDERIQKRPRRSSHPSVKPVTSSDFVRPIVEDQSTFHRVMELQREKTSSVGERLECADPDVVDVVCKIVNEVRKRRESEEKELPKEENQEVSQENLDQNLESGKSDVAINGQGDVGLCRVDRGIGATLTAIASSCDQRRPSADASKEPPQLTDKQFCDQSQALDASRLVQRDIASLVKEAEEILNETKKMTGDLAKKIIKLD